VRHDGGGCGDIGVSVRSLSLITDPKTTGTPCEGHRFKLQQRAALRIRPAQMYRLSCSLVVTLW